LLDQQRKAFAIQFHCVDAHVHQQFGTVIGANGQRVPGAGDVDDHAVARRVQAIVERVDGNAVAHGATGEHFVGNVAQGQHRPTEGSAEGKVFIIVGHGHGTHQEIAAINSVGTGHFAQVTRLVRVHAPGLCQTGSHHVETLDRQDRVLCVPQSGPFN